MNWQISPQILIAPFAIWLVSIVYMAWRVDVDYAPIALIPAVFILAYFVWRKPLSLWWYRRNPPELDAPVVRLLEEHHTYYQSLSPDARRTFQRRIVMYAIDKSYEPKGFDTVSNDVKAALGIQAATLHVYRDDYIKDGIENIILYRHLFRTPAINAYHCGEYYAEDGALIFSIPHFMGGVLQPHAYYPIGMHIYAQVFRHQHAQWSYPPIDANLWEYTLPVCRMKANDIFQLLGTGDTPLHRWSLAVVMFFNYRNRMIQHLPQLHNQLEQLFEPEDAHPSMVY